MNIAAKLLAASAIGAVVLAGCGEDEQRVAGTPAPMEKRTAPQSTTGQAETAPPAPAATPASEKQADSLRELDKDSDGFVTKEEFEAGDVKIAFAQLDANGDGRLSMSEMQGDAAGVAGTSGPAGQTGTSPGSRR